jgi:hypothetical protein
MTQNEDTGLNSTRQSPVKETENVLSVERGQMAARSGYCIDQREWNRAMALVTTVPQQHCSTFTQFRIFLHPTEKHQHLLRIFGRQGIMEKLYTEDLKNTISFTNFKKQWQVLVNTAMNLRVLKRWEIS